MAMIESYAVSAPEQASTLAERVEQRTYEEFVASVAETYHEGEARRTLGDFAPLLLENQDEHGNVLPEDIFDRRRGDEVVRFDQVVFSGASNEGLVQIRSDRTGYHRLVVEVDPAGGWKEATVYDGSSLGDSTLRVDVMRPTNSKAWSPRTVEYGGSDIRDRDSFYIQELNGNINAWSHDGATGLDTMLAPLDQVYQLIQQAESQPDAKIYQIDDYR